MKALFWFAGEMHEKLRRNTRKGGWEGCEKHYLLRRLQEEVDELKAATRKRSACPSDIRQEAADVANFAMMIADNFGRDADTPGDG